MNPAEKWTLRLLTVGVFGVLALQVSRRLEAREVGGFVEPRCSATQGGISCTFTNASGEASRSCVFGTVTNKADPKKTATSQQLCTGRLDGFETKTVTGEWMLGTPAEMCSVAGQFGDRLDWSQCEFAVKH